MNCKVLYTYHCCPQKNILSSSHTSSCCLEDPVWMLGTAQHFHAVSLRSTTHGIPGWEFLMSSKELLQSCPGHLPSCTYSVQLPLEVKLDLAVLITLLWLVLWLCLWQANSHHFIFPGHPSPLLGLFRSTEEVGLRMVSLESPCVKPAWTGLYGGVVWGWLGLLLPWDGGISSSLWAGHSVVHWLNFGM